MRHSEPGGDVKPLGTAEAAALAASLGQSAEALPRFNWSSVDALTDGRGVVLT